MLGAGVENGGIAGRAVLIDWATWKKSQVSELPSGDGGYKIPVSELEATLKSQNTSLEPGDILLVRTGFLSWYESKTEAQTAEHTEKGCPSLGLDPSEEMRDWLWQNHFAAVGADNPALESWPPSSELGTDPSL